MDYYGYDYDVTSSAATGLFAGFAGLGIYLLFMCGLSVFMIVCMWKIFKKAGKNGWESLIPIYNFIVLLQIVELPLWYIALFLVPFANIYAIFKIYIELAHKFGKSTGFGVAMVFFGIICFPMLAFGKNSYNGNSVNNQQPVSQQNISANKKFCPNCGMQNDVTANVCFSCGNGLHNTADMNNQQFVSQQNISTNKKFCPNCGMQNDATANVCFSCGKSF